MLQEFHTPWNLIFPLKSILLSQLMAPTKMCVFHLDLLRVEKLQVWVMLEGFSWGWGVVDVSQRCNMPTRGTLTTAMFLVDHIEVLLLLA